MIITNKGSIEMKGLQIELLADLCTVLKAARDNFGDKQVDLVVETSKMSDQKINEGAERLKEDDKIVKDFLALIFENGGK